MRTNSRNVSACTLVHQRQIASSVNSSVYTRYSTNPMPTTTEAIRIQVSAGNFSRQVRDGDVAAAMNT